jgi:hypothetical protein
MALFLPVQVIHISSIALDAPPRDPDYRALNVSILVATPPVSGEVIPRPFATPILDKRD